MILLYQKLKFRNCIKILIDLKNCINIVEELVVKI